MARAMLAFVAIGFCLSAHSANAPKPAALPITESDSVLMVYREDHGLGSSGGPFLIIAIWPDGRMIWSEDRLKGGVPFRTGNIDAKRVTAVLNRFVKDGLFENKKLADGYFGPDSQFTSILVKSGKKELEMSSWHELHEASEGAVAFKAGAGLVAKNSTRLEVLRDEPADYLFFRFVWSETRSKMTDLIPAESKAINGKIVRQAGVMTWQEEPLKEKAGEPKK